MLYAPNLSNLLAHGARAGTWGHDRGGLIQQRTTRRRVLSGLDVIALCGARSPDRFYMLERSLHCTLTNGPGLSRDYYAVLDEVL